MNLLTTFQEELLKAIGRSLSKETFYLTGGTALSAFYLHHRYSEDLDFFTSDPTAVSRSVPILHQIAQELDAKLTFTRTTRSFLECVYERDSSEFVNLDFAQDAPYRLEPTVHNERYGISIDNSRDIACNKLSALFDRAEPKDFVDVYFICQELMSFDELLQSTRQKHVGIDDYWLAVALQRVEQVEILPRMVKSITVEELRNFFSSLVIGLMDQIDPDQG